MKIKQVFPLVTTLVLIVTLFGTIPATAAPSNVSSLAAQGPKPKFSDNVAFDVSPTLRELAARRITPPLPPDDQGEVREENGPEAGDSNVYFPDTAVQNNTPQVTIPSTATNFEGLSNQDNFNIFGGRVNPPDPVGDVGPNNYVEMVNLTFAVYDKHGNLLLGPVDTGTLWDNFAVPDCTDPSGDPVVLYDQLMDRWILTQFTTSGMNPDGSFNGLPFYNCVAISQTGDPTGAYYRYAFITSQAGSTSTFFPDYPKYGNWTDSYV